MKYTFHMDDAWGDDFEYTVIANSEAAARSIATMACDDANPGKLLRTEPL